MVNVVGFDVGGVNIKGAFITYSSNQIVKKRIQSQFYPMWLHTPEELPILLQDMIRELALDEPIDAIGITMTAEVSDAYYTKKEGVSHILSTFSTILPQIPKRVITNFNQFISISEALENYMAVASANWIATALFIGKKFPRCILLDIGSTTTDIIPISHGLPDTIGKTDMDRLLQGELVYTGALRSTIPSIVHKVPIRGKMCPISFEKFALIADVHLLLNHISAEDYTCDTADERQKTEQDTLARLARIICADINLLSKAELYEMATYIYERQLDQISAGIKQVMTAREEFDLNVPFVITGLGREFLGRKVAEKMGFHQIIDLEEELGAEGAIASPAAAIAILLAEKYEAI
ncbi:MAG TPA: hydantoinase/oxoprolinase family protein [Candidatus Deferrimicrobium sp.]|nr:hydantoinase/oxoprolinase family protein [Candidatus Deferrimicrobium sp.]